jgi:hypothetical protein
VVQVERSCTTMETGGLLPGLVSRADIVVFPVQCISHAAAGAIKKLCRQADKPYAPLRSTGAGALLHALKSAGATAPVAAD